jgi:tetratricopeptide (TPR) repeat protein
MFFRKNILFLVIIIAAIGCSSPSTLKVLSTPIEAEVNVIDNSGIAVSIGKTPLTINESEVYKGSNKYSQIQIKKDGYVNQEIVLMKSMFGGDTTVNLQMKKDENVQNIGEQSITQEKVASGIARANGLIQSKQFDEAEKVMLNFIEQYPSVSVGYDYLGNINYLQKKYAKALKYYNRAVSLNPQNADRKVIVERIQTLVKSQSGEVQ